MNLIAFPHYTCGGLLCEILNNEQDKTFLNGGIDTIGHNMGKFGDSDGIFDEYDHMEIDSRFRDLKRKLPDDYWVSTHCWPKFLNLENFKTVISVTTETYRSRVYRWIRCCQHHYISSDSWQNSKHSEMQYIDKVRETAKNYLQPFLSINLPTIKNIEFSDIVECSPIFVELVGHLDWTSKFENWKKNNNFLYSPNLWNNFFLKRFHEAEYEQFTSRSYVYQ